MPQHNHRPTRACLFLATALLALAGCDRSVIIQQPLSGTYTNPVTTFAVKFHPDFKPGTFQATLSGTSITNLFQPTPAPNSVSTATVAFPPNFMDYEFNSNKQKLIVDAEFTTSVFYFFGIPTRFTTDTSEFSPPRVMVYRGRTSFDFHLTLKERETITATAFVDEAPKEPLTVTITGHPLVSLNDQPAGQNIQVVIQRNDRRADFTVRGIQTGSEVFRIRAIATGYASGVGVGFVERNE